MGSKHFVTAFRDSLTHEKPDSHWSDILKALWLDGKGDWEGAHQLVQDGTSPDAAWVHAYLHRKEGDLWNADYWYRKASRERPSVSLEEEWEELVEVFTNKSSKP